VPNNIADKEGKWPELSNALYGLGRVVEMYKGYKIAMHTGSIDGYYSNLTFIPSENIAIFMVHNSNPGGSFRSGMAFPVIDRLLNLVQTPWSERYRKDYLKNKADDKADKDSLNATQVKNTAPTHSLKDYQGKYYSPIYGDMLIEMENNHLVLSFRHQRSVLEHFHYDQFRTNEERTDNPDFRISFQTNGKGEIDKLITDPFGDPMAEFVKTKTP
jgi:hypothetical protein